MSTAANLEIIARRVDRCVIEGHAVDYARPERSLALEAWVDGVVAAATIADLYSEELASVGSTSPRHGFYFAFSAVALEGAKHLEIRVANRDDLPGQTVELKTPSRAPALSGAVDWQGGLRFSGWLDSPGDETPYVRAFVDDRLVREAPADIWRQVGAPDSRPKRAFDLCLPAAFADGRVWSVTFRGQDGRELAGSPAVMWAPSGGLEVTLAKLATTPGQRLQGAQFDRVLPNATPFSTYVQRRGDYAPKPRRGASHRRWGVLVLDGDRLEKSVKSLEALAEVEWTGAVIAARAGSFAFDPAEVSDFLRDHAEAAEWFLFVFAGLELDEDCLARFDACACEHTDARLIYVDREVVTAEGDVWPLALPAFDYERTLEQGFYAPLFALRRDVVERAASIGVENWFRLANLALDEDVVGATAVHMPGPAARHDISLMARAASALRVATASHLVARGMAAETESFRVGDIACCRVRRRHQTKPGVSILIPTRDRGELLRQCLDTIYDGAAAVRAEILVIDNETRDKQSRDYLIELRKRGVKILSAPGPFNFARLNNFAAAEARGEYLCFLNNDVKALDGQWLEEMLSRHADPTVGAVGAKLLWPSGMTQHAGVTLGINFAPTHAFRDRLDGDPGYGGQLTCAHETGAVTAACMTTPRKLFVETGGFDALRFPVNFNDVDYCLRLATRGLRIVFTPFAKLQHLESASRGHDQAVDANQRLQRELRSLRNIWGEALIADPSYSPLLALSDPPYAALAATPRDLAPRRRRIPPPRRPPPGF